MHCRAATFADCSRLVEIYAPFVAETAISFAEEMPTVEDFQQKMEGKYPFYVCEEDGRVLGYAYAGPYRVREAYRWGVEVSIYVEPAAQRRGVGKLLMGTLLDTLRRQGYQAAYSCVTLPNEKSIALHSGFGFKQAGLFEHAGYKLGRWRSVMWMQLLLGDFPDPPGEPVRFDELT